MTIKEKRFLFLDSGYAWLVVDSNGKLTIVTTPNQNTPISFGFCVISGMDVWEHAYFLQRFNDRAAYIEDWFHVINWKQADNRYKQCMGIEDERNNRTGISNYLIYIRFYSFTKFSHTGAVAEYVRYHLSCNGSSSNEFRSNIFVPLCHPLKSHFLRYRHYSLYFSQNLCFFYHIPLRLYLIQSFCTP